MSDQPNPRRDPFRPAADKPLFVLRPTFQGGWFLVGITSQVALVLGLGAGFLWPLAGPLGLTLMSSSPWFPMAAGLLFVCFVVLPVSLHYAGTKRLMEGTEYVFFPDRFEYREEGALQEYRSIALADVTEVRLRQSRVVRGRGTIVLARAAMAESRLASGIRLTNVLDCDRAYARVSELVNSASSDRDRGQDDSGLLAA